MVWKHKNGSFPHFLLPIKTALSNNRHLSDQEAWSIEARPHQRGCASRDAVWDREDSWHSWQFSCLHGACSFFAGSVQPFGMPRVCVLYYRTAGPSATLHVPATLTQLLLAIAVCALPSLLPPTFTACLPSLSHSVPLTHCIRQTQCMTHIVALTNCLTHCTGWWFQICFIFIPIWGNDPVWRAYFSDGWFNHQLVYQTDTASRID